MTIHLYQNETKGALQNRKDVRFLSQLPTTLIALLIGAPIFLIAVQLFSGSSDIWERLQRTVLKDYLFNTVSLLLGVGGLTILIGVSTAWLMSTYRFFGQRVLGWALILPLAFPSYIIAYTYKGILDYTGPVQRFTRNVLQWEDSDALIPFEIMSLPGILLLLSFVLYPYVYLITRATFQRQSQTLLEASYLLGKSNWTTFFRVALPLARPAIIAGASLVWMEVLNEYGAVTYYGVPTFTTGIFRAWLSEGDLPSAVRLSAILVAFVFTILWLERKQRGAAKYNNDSRRNKPLRRIQLQGGRAILAFSICFLPVFLGFLLPFLQLSAWAFQTFSKTIDDEFFRIFWDTVSLASLSAIIALIAAIIMAYANRQGPNALLLMATRIASIGYSVPGAVIAIGVLIPLIFIDKQLFGRLLLTGSAGALAYAYLVRFLAVSYNSVASAYEKISPNLDKASRMLGSTSLRTLFRVHLPLLRNSLFTALLLVFVDIMKELPLTLILRPFNFDTLATKAYELASDEMLEESAVYALLIIAVVLLPVLLLNRMSEEK